MYKSNVKRAGAGVISNGDHETPCSFSISQTDIRKIVANCRTRRHFEKLVGLFGSPAGSLTLRGKTKEGLELLAQGGFAEQMKLGSGPCKISVSFQSMAISATGKVGKRIRFYLTNFYFDGEESLGELRNRRVAGEAVEGIELFIRSRVMLLETLGNGVIKYNEAKKNRGVAVTASVTTAYVGTEDSIVEAVDDLVLLLTLALGRSIGWVRWEIFDEDGHVVKQQSVDAVVKSWSGIQLIAKRDVIPFVEQAAIKFRCDTSPNWNFRNLILAYTDAKLEHDFLENRGLKMAIVLEIVKFQFLACNPGSDLILSPKRFKKLASGLRPVITSVIGDLGVPVPPEGLESIREKVPELNRVSFKKVVRQVYDSLNLEISVDLLDLVIGVRNSLVHNGKFLDHSDPWKQYCLLLTEVGRLLLAALGWRGTFHDWASNPNSQREMKFISNVAKELQATSRA